MHLERGGLERAYLERFVATAHRRSVREIGISEHAYHFVEAAPLHGNPDYVARRSHGYRTDDYVRLIEAARADGLPLRLSIEMDYFPGREADIAAYLAEYPWDYVIGGVHWIDDWGFDLEAADWDGRDVAAAYRDYFALAEQAVRSGLFDTFAHPDVIKVHGRKPGPEFTEQLLTLYDRLVAAAAESNVCLEVSSAGLRKRVGEIYPDERLLQRAFAAGVNITLGSDAHDPEEVGWEYQRLIACTRAAGYTTVTTFAGRQSSQQPLVAASR